MLIVLGIYWQKHRIRLAKDIVFCLVDGSFLTMI